MDVLASSGLVFALIAIVVLILIYLYSCVYKLAKRYGRNAAGHTIISLFLSPFVSIIHLLCAGETDEHRKARIQEEEKWRAEVHKTE
ncbi:MAG: hypothetical protein IIX42_00630 [Alistipes sp.]|nr:hypothetical protein [Alistipes sp.]